MMLKIILPALFLAPMLLAQNAVVTCEELQNLAERNFERVRIERLSLEQAKHAAAISSAARLPRVDLSAQYTHISEYGSIDLALPGIPLPLKTISFGDGNIYEAALNISAPLFYGFRLKRAEESMMEKVHIAERNVEGAALNVRIAVLRLYRSAQLARANTRIVEAQSRLLENLLADRRSLLEHGQSIAYDTLVLSTRIMQLKVDGSAAVNAYRNAIAALRQITGISRQFDVNETLPPTDALEDIPQNAAEVLSGEAFERRYELRNLASVRAIAELQASSARSALYPSIAASASFRYGKPGVDQIRNDWMDYYTAGIRLDWNIWAWNSDKRNIEKHELEARKAELESAGLRAAVRTRIESLLNDLRHKREALLLIEAQVEQESSRSELAQARLRQGLATVTETIDAETALTSAMLRREKTTCEYLITRADLGAEIGREW